MRNKITKFSRLFQNHKLTLPQVIATKSKCQNDLHQGSFHINRSNITGHHRTLIMSEIHEPLFIWSPRPWMANYRISANIWMINQNYYVCYNFSLRLHWIPWVLHVQGEKHTHTHTHTHPFNGPFTGTTQVSRYHKSKTNLDFTEARDSERQWHQLGHMQVCISLQTDNHPAPYHSVFYRPDALPAAQPTASKYWRQNVSSVTESKLFYLFSRVNTAFSALTLLVGQ